MHTCSHLAYTIFALDVLDGKSQEPRHEMEIDSEDLGSPEEDQARRRHMARYHPLRLQEGYFPAI